LAPAFRHTGVPHAVCPVADLAAIDVPALGAFIRRHPFSRRPAPTPYFIHVAGPDAVAIRTYERGVEAETLACGTGIVAAALVAEKLGWVRAPVRVTTAGGDVLEVSSVPLALTGPAEHAFRGEFDYR
jgi:diaminopimelate epimerase